MIKSLKQFLHLEKLHKMRIGRKHSEETKRKISETKRKQHIIPKNAFKKGHIPWIKGKYHSEETKQKIKKTKLGSLPTKTSFQKGHIPWNKGKEFMSGEKHPHWKGGKKQRKEDKRWYIWRPNHPFADKNKYVERSRLIVEDFIGRYLLPTEHIHHINGRKDDDRIENLHLCKSNLEHLKIHWNKKQVKSNLSKYVISR